MQFLNLAVLASLMAAVASASPASPLERRATGVHFTSSCAGESFVVTGATSCQPWTETTCGNEGVYADPGFCAKLYTAAKCGGTQSGTIQASAEFDPTDSFWAGNTRSFIVWKTHDGQC